MLKVEIGKAGKTPVEINLMQLVDTRMLIQANSGAGKSWLLRLIAEQAGSQIQTIVLDPEGEFATLREKLDMVLVGDDGEVKTHPKTAKLMARKLLELNLSAVIDLYELNLLDRRLYVQLFLESLLSLPRKLWRPLLVVIDEAHNFAPEKSKSVSTDAVISLMCQGRKRGFCGILATQRLSKLHKDAAAEANNLIFGRTALDIDLVRVGDMLGMSKADRRVLRSLSSGECFGFGPAFNYPEVFQFTSAKVKTTHPQAGQRHKIMPPKASKNIQAVMAQLSNIQFVAEKEARDLKEAQQEIAVLKRQLRSKAVTPDEKAIEKAVEDRTRWWQKRLNKRDEVIGDLVQRLDRIAAQCVLHIKDRTSLDPPLPSFRGGHLESLKRKEVAFFGEPPTTPDQAFPPPTNTTPSPSPNTHTPPPSIRKTAVTQAYDGDLKLRAGERRILSVLAQRSPLRLTKAQLGTLSRFKISGGTFGAYFGTLKRHNLIIQGSDGLIEITQEGIDYLGTNIPPAPTTTEELQEMWGKVLRRGERSILDTLINFHPSSISKEDLGEATGYTVTGGTFGAYIGTLRRNGLIEVEGSEVKASESCFI